MVVNRDEVIQELKRIFDKVSDGRVSDIELSEDMAIIDDLGLHSIDLLEIAFEIENKWEIDIDNEEYKTVTTIGDAIDMIINKKNG